MFAESIKQIKIGFILFLLLTILTGAIYPLVVTGLAQLICPAKANGSLVFKDNQVIGSWLIGQSFTGPNYFWSRPSATTPFPYNAASSSGSNFGPTNPVFLNMIKARVVALQNASLSKNNVPVDFVTSSASGLDPDITPYAAFYQVARIAKSRNINEGDIQLLIQRLMQYRTFGILGEPRVNVLKLNLALDNFNKDVK